MTTFSAVSKAEGGRIDSCHAPRCGGGKSGGG